MCAGPYLTNVPFAGAVCAAVVKVGVGGAWATLPEGLEATGPHGEIRGGR